MNTTVSPFASLSLFSSLSVYCPSTMREGRKTSLTTISTSSSEVVKESTQSTCDELLYAALLWPFLHWPVSYGLSHCGTPPPSLSVGRKCSHTLSNGHTSLALMRSRFISTSAFTLALTLIRLASHDCNISVSES